MTDNAALQQEFNFRLSLLRLVTSTPAQTDRDVATTAESRQIESFAALVASDEPSR